MKLVLSSPLWLLIVGLLWIHPDGITAQTPSESVTGTVLTAEGEPLGDARISLIALSDNFSIMDRIWSRTSEEALITTQTNNSGRFRLESPPMGMYKVRVEASNRLGMLYPLLPITTSIELPPVKLYPLQVAQVMAKHQDGSPLIDAAVFIQPSDPRFWRKKMSDGWRTQERGGRTDSEGRITFPRTPGEILAIEIAEPGSLAWSTLIFEQTLKVDQKAVVHHLPDKELSSIEFEVVDDQGQALVGALVGVGPAAQPVGRSDADGKLQLLGQGGETLHIFLADGRRARSRVPAFEPSEERKHRMIVPPALTLNGRVVSGDIGLAGSLVWPGDDPGRFLKADAHGHFKLSASIAPRFWVQAEAAGHHAKLAEPQIQEKSWQPVTIDLPATGSILGRVFDAEGQPLVGVDLSAKSLIPRAPNLQREAFRADLAAARARSQKGGHFELKGLRFDDSFRIEASRSGLSSAKVIGQPGTPIRITLQTARPAFGRVLDQNQKPIPDVEITLIDALDPKTQRITVISNHEGRFELEDLSFERFDLEAVKGGYPPMNSRHLEAPSKAEAIDLGTLVMIEGLRLAGRVIDGDGNSISGARVVALAAPEDSFKSLANRRLRERPVRSNQQGNFAIRDLLPGQRIFLVAEHEGFLPGVLEGIDIPAQSEATIVLRPASRVAGRVINEDGEPVAAARISLSGLEPAAGTVGVRQPGDRNDLEVETRTDGTFTLEGVAPGTVRVQALAEGYQPAETKRLDVPRGAQIEEITFLLETGATLEGRVTDREGQGIAKAVVRSGTVRALSNPEGRYRLGGLKTGKQTLVVQRAGYNDQRAEIEVAEGKNHPKDFTLDGGFLIRGRVVDAAGQGLSGARLDLTAHTRVEQHAFQASSDPDGAFELLVARGNYEVAIKRHGFASKVLRERLSVDAEIEDLEITLKPGASLSGQILGLQFDELAEVEIEAWRGRRLEQEAVVDYSGHYALTDLGHGIWRVLARLRGGQREAETRLVITPETEALERDIEFGGIQLTGQALFDQRPLPRASVSLTGLDLEAYRQVSTDHQGRFQLSDIKPGRYRLSLAHNEEWLIHNEDIDLITSRDVLVDLTPVEIRGQVSSGASGDVLGGARIALQQMYGEQAGSLITVSTNDAGQFHLARISTGEYQLRVEKEGFAPQSQRLSIRKGDPLLHLDIALQPTSGLDLLVRSAAGPPEVVTLSLKQIGHSESQFLDSSGQARFTTLPPGRWEVMISAPRLVSRVLTVDLPKASPIEVELQPAAYLSVRVAPLLHSRSRGTLTLTRADGMPFVGSDLAGRPIDRWDLHHGEVGIDGLSEGSWTINVKARNGQTWQQTIAVQAGSVNEVRID